MPRIHKRERLEVIIDSCSLGHKPVTTEDVLELPIEREWSHSPARQTATR